MNEWVMILPEKLFSSQEIFKVSGDQESFLNNWYLWVLRSDTPQYHIPEPTSLLLQADWLLRVFLLWFLTPATFSHGPTTTPSYQWANRKQNRRSKLNSKAFCAHQHRTACQPLRDSSSRSDKSGGGPCTDKQNVCYNKVPRSMNDKADSWL